MTVECLPCRFAGLARVYGRGLYRFSGWAGSDFGNPWYWVDIAERFYGISSNRIGISSQ